jgi:hypothetical protein
MRASEPSSFTDTVLFPIASLLFTAVGFWAGWLLWQRTAEPAQAIAPAAT